MLVSFVQQNTCRGWPWWWFNLGDLTCTWVPS